MCVCVCVCVVGGAGGGGSASLPSSRPPSLRPPGEFQAPCEDRPGPAQGRARPRGDPRAASPGWVFAGISDSGGLGRDPGSRSALLQRWPRTLSVPSTPGARGDETRQARPAGLISTRLTPPRGARACDLSHAGPSRSRTAPLAARVTPSLLPNLTGMRSQAGPGFRAARRRSGPEGEEARGWGRFGSGAPQRGPASLSWATGISANGTGKAWPGGQPQGSCQGCSEREL